uniref:Uncharacterized protein n=1 Tax=viral metagenome TaxID=1070528 RepID=A0A6M3JCR6_9ZZZZ
MGRPVKTDKGRPVDTDELDLAIWQSIQEFPAIPIRARVQLLKSRGFQVEKSALQRRIAKFPEKEQVKAIRRGLVSLAGKAQDKFREKIEAGDYQAIRDLLFGVGILQHSSKVQTQELPADEEGLVDELDNYDTARLRRLRDKLRERLGDPGDSRRDSRSESPVDEGLGPGEPTPPDA